jgi:hypothetical protein
MNRRNNSAAIVAWVNATKIVPRDIKCGTDLFSSPKEYWRALLNSVMSFKLHKRRISGASEEVLSSHEGLRPTDLISIEDNSAL